MAYRDGSRPRARGISRDSNRVGNAHAL